MSNRRYDKIRKLLIIDWDPIGIEDDPNAEDEYDLYAKELELMLIKNLSKEEIFGYLWTVETEHMGLEGNINITKNVADKISVL